MKKNERFSHSVANFNKALSSLGESAALPIKEKRDLSGIIKDFELVYELSWKVLKLFLANKGHETQSAKDVFSQAYSLKYIDDQDVWLSMISDRNNTVHTYDEKFAKEMVERIKKKYVKQFAALGKLFDHSIS